MELAPPIASAAERAERAAAAVARAAGLCIRELSAYEDLQSVYQLYESIWRPDPKNPPVTSDLLRALTKAGNYVGGAFDGERLVGACVGFFGAPADSAIHSHIAGVPADMRGRNVGFALKLHQRAWALRRGVATIGWTFDPLVRRNAYFNLAKLAGVAAEYLPNFYGGMHDAINGGDDSDRLLVNWQLTAPEVVAAAAGTVGAGRGLADAARASGAAVGLDAAADGSPVIGSAGAATLLVGIPADIEAMRSADAALAHRWRLALRETLGEAMARGARVTGFDRDGWYILTGSETMSEVDGRSSR